MYVVNSLQVRELWCFSFPKAPSVCVREREKALPVSSSAHPELCRDGMVNAAWAH